MQNRHSLAVSIYHSRKLTIENLIRAYSPDDNRFDLRPFLLPPQYEGWAYKKIDDLVEKMEAQESQES